MSALAGTESLGSGLSLGRLGLTLGLWLAFALVGTEVSGLRSGLSLLAGLAVTAPWRCFGRAKKLVLNHSHQQTSLGEKKDLHTGVSKWVRSMATYSLWVCSLASMATLVPVIPDNFSKHCGNVIGYNLQQVPVCIFYHDISQREVSQ